MQEANGLKFSDYIGASERKASPTALPAWHAVTQHAQRLRSRRVSDLFNEQPDRFSELSLVHDGLLADFSKQLIDRDALSALHTLAQQSALDTAITAFFGGDTVNFTEARPALHMAMRHTCPPPEADAAAVRDTDRRMRAFAAALRSGQYTGACGRPFKRIINIGIGGSDLGPRMAVEALASRAQPDVRFVASIDPDDLAQALDGADADTTLFIISSKSFATAETLANATAARHWLRTQLGAQADLRPHLVAVSNAVAAATDFGVAPERIFALPDWVGGRYSVWSAIGLPVLMAIGEGAFDEFLAGARAMDTHFCDAPINANLPVSMALVGLWNINFLAIDSLALLPYAHGLRSLPAWLQQLDMESNGKHCLRDGSASQVATAPIVWGGAGTIGQHAFHQLFYQGTRTVALDFIAFADTRDPQRAALLQNALAQSAALMQGRDLDAARRSLLAKGVDANTVEHLAPHLVCAGNQPSTTIIAPQLTPYRLGQLMALYEHKVFVQGWIWGVNSFDQYGVELGKEMARALASQGADTPDPSTAGLLSAAASMRDSAQHQP